MILDKYVNIRLNNSNIKRLLSLGYNGKINDIIKIKVSDLTKGSHVKINVECDICHNKKILSYYNYVINISNLGFYGCCRKCSIKKYENTNIERYDVKNPMQNETIKKKMVDTCNKKYGVMNPSQSEEIKKKKENTCLINHGVKYSSQSKKIKEKMKNTCLKNHGVKYPTQSKEIKEKIIKSNLRKYGVKNPMQNDKIKEKLSKSILEKYGVENPFQSEKIKEKIKITNIQKFGCEYAMQNDNIKEKTYQTQIERYGEAYLKFCPKYNPNSIFYLDLISEKLNLIIQHALNGGEKKFHKYWVDGFISDYNIVIEWDEKHHKKHLKKDLKRQQYIEDNFKCKFIRIDEDNFNLDDIIKQLKSLIK